MLNWPPVRLKYTWTGWGGTRCSRGDAGDLAAWAMAPPQTSRRGTFEMKHCTVIHKRRIRSAFEVKRILDIIWKMPALKTATANANILIHTLYNSVMVFKKQHAFEACLFWGQRCYRLLTFKRLNQNDKKQITENKRCPPYLDLCYS